MAFDFPVIRLPICLGMSVIKHIQTHIKYTYIKQAHAINKLSRSDLSIDSCFSLGKFLDQLFFVTRHLVIFYSLHNCPTGLKSEILISQSSTFEHLDRAIVILRLESITLYYWYVDKLKAIRFVLLILFFLFRVLIFQKFASTSIVMW